MTMERRPEAASLITPSDVAPVLREIAGLLALEPGNRFRSRAYERGAKAIEGLSEPTLRNLVRTGRLSTVPALGAALSRLIEEIVNTGRSQLLERLRERYPPGAAQLSGVLSLSRIRALHKALPITTLEELRAACVSGDVRRIRGFGEKTEQALVKRVDAFLARREGMTLNKAELEATTLADDLRRAPGIVAIEIAGALRRRVEVVDRLDLVIAAEDANELAVFARGAAGVSTTSRLAEGRLLCRRPHGLDAHLRFVDHEALPAAWLEETGSVAHFSKLAAIAASRDLVLDGEGLETRSGRIQPRSESDIYARLDLPFIPPELREDAGEIEAAAIGELPDDLLEVVHVRGAIHCHTDYSDGRQTVEQMARGAERLGLDYLTITDHSVSATYAHGLEVDRLRRQWDDIARVQETVSVRLLRGTESDILRDGALDYPDAVLEQLDVVIASIHNRFGMDADEMTRRIVRAIRHPLFKIWGHPLGRYVLTRPPFAVHMEEVLDAVANSRAAIEVNGDPHRLDLEPRWIREASRRGIRFVVSTDAHSVAGLGNLRFGVDMARRGWLRPGDVLNTLGAEQFASAVRP